ADPELCQAAKGLDIIGGMLEHVWFGIAQANSVHRLLGLPARYEAVNDNRWHQHHLLWPSTTRRSALPAADADFGRGRLEAGAAIAGQLHGETPTPAASAGDAPFEIDLSKPIGGPGWYEPEQVGGSWHR